MQLLVHVALEIDLALSVLLQDLVALLARKRGGAEDQQVEDHPETEHIADGLVMTFLVLEVRDFRGDIARSATTDEDVVLDIGKSGQPEISNDALVTVFVSENDVLGLQVSMHDPLLVHGLDSVEEALHNFQYLLGGKGMPFLYLVVKQPAPQILNHEVHGIICFVNPVQFHKVIMV